MRGVLFLVLTLLPLCACKSSEKKPAAAPPRRTATARIVGPAPSNERPSVRPVQAANGRIIAVRENLRFVIVDFPPRQMPRMDQRLSVYRLDQKVAEIKISGPYLGNTVAADITAGEPHEGDLVKDL